MIPGSRYEEAREELAEELRTITRPDGERMRVEVFRPEEIYAAALGNPPDLMVYFDDLDWRSAGTVGHGGLYLSENDTGPDDSVHAMDGIFVLYDPARRYAQQCGGREHPGRSPDRPGVDGRPRARRQWRAAPSS